MKKYDRETKKWVEEAVLEKRRNARNKKLCRGGKDHDYVLVLPAYTTYDPATYCFNPKEYYKLMDEKFEYLEKWKEKVRALGIKRFSDSWNSKESRLFICSVCKKQNYEHQ